MPYMSRKQRRSLATSLTVFLAFAVAILAFVVVGFAVSTAPNFGELGTVGFVVAGLVAYVGASLALPTPRKATS